MNEKRLERSKIDDMYKWDITDVYKDDNAWNKDYKKLNSLLKKVLIYKDKIMESSSNLLGLLESYYALDRMLTNVYVYANLKYCEDTRIEESIILKDKANTILTKVSEETSFIRTEILNSSLKRVKEFIKENKKLNVYKFSLEKLFRMKKHILSLENEKLLAGMSDILESFSDIYDVLNDTDMAYGTVIIDGEEIELTHSNFVKFLRHKDQVVRKNVFETFYKSYENLKTTLTTNYKFLVRTDNYEAKIRNYKNACEMSLYPNDIDLSVYNSLINAVNKKLDVLHRYVDLKKKELNLDEIHMYDIYADMVTDNAENYEYDKACNMVMDGLKILGDEYSSVVSTAFEDKWIDVYDNIGKRSGAFSWGTYDSRPYILLNYNKTLDSVFTLAHEMGHSMHSYYTHSKQPFVYGNYTLFLAEIASTVNEVLLSKYLLKNSADNKLKKVILNELMDKFKGTIYRQTMFAEFELIAHELDQKNEILTESKLGDLYYELNKKYYGDKIINDEMIRYEWMRIPHFYRSFYVYQYATGLSIAFKIASDIYEGKNNMLDKYLKFLSSGSSDYPLNLLKIVDIDMTSPKVIEEALDYFNTIIEEYIKLG